MGSNADLVAFAPDEEWVVTLAALYHRHPVSPFPDRMLTGAVRGSYLKGRETDRSKPSGWLLDANRPS